MVSNLQALITKNNINRRVLSEHTNLSLSAVSKFIKYNVCPHNLPRHVVERRVKEALVKLGVDQSLVEAALTKDYLDHYMQTPSLAAKLGYRPAPTETIQAPEQIMTTNASQIVEAAFRLGQRSDSIQHHPDALHTPDVRNFAEELDALQLACEDLIAYPWIDVKVELPSDQRYYLVDEEGDWFKAQYVDNKWYSRGGILVFPSHWCAVNEVIVGKSNRLINSATTCEKEPCSKPKASEGWKKIGEHSPVITGIDKEPNIFYQAICGSQLFNGYFEHYRQDGVDEELFIACDLSFENSEWVIIDAHSQFSIDDVLCFCEIQPIKLEIKKK